MGIKKIQILSNNIGFSPCPEPDDEVEQHLTISSSGQVWFSGYHFNEGFGRFMLARRIRLSIGQEAAQEILSHIESFFLADQLIIMSDVGSWKLLITDVEGQKRSISGPLTKNPAFSQSGIISSIVRSKIMIDNLFVFDGNRE